MKSIGSSAPAKDISSRKQAEIALHASEERYRRAVRAEPAADVGL
jgi:PAS domain-containing protein